MFFIAPRGRINGFFVLAGLFGLYTQVPLEIGEQRLPNIIGLVSSVVLTLMHVQRIKWSYIGYIFALLFVALISIFLAGNYEIYFEDHMRAVILLTLSLFIGLGLYLGLESYGREGARKLFLGFTIFILVGALLETFTPLSDPLKGFAAEFWDYNLLGHSARDMGIAGFVRPTFLTSEPSYVARGVVAFATASAIVIPTLRGIVLPLGLVLASLIAIGSPTALLAAPMIFGAYFLVRGESSSRRIRSRRFWVTVAISIAIGIPLLFAAASIFSERLALFQSGSDTSALIRLYGGLELGIRAALEYPISGVGLGGIGAAREIIIQSILEFGVAYSVVAESWELEINNGIGAHLLQFGFVCLALYIAVWWRFMSGLSSGNAKLVMAMMVLISFAMGDIYSPAYITYIFLFCAAARSSLRGELRPRSPRGFPKPRNPRLLVPVPRGG